MAGKTKTIPGAIIFDSSTIISLAMNGLLGKIRDLKGIFKGNFFITKEIKEEVIDRPLNVKRFELEALRVKKLLDQGVLQLPSSIGISDEEITQKTNKMVEIANDMFTSRGESIKLIHSGEASCLALSRILLDKKIPHVIAIDERTARMLGEKPEKLKELLEKKLNIKVSLKKDDFKYFRGFKFIRSAELLYVIWKKGLTELKGGKMVLDAFLYAVKFKGCAISDDEIAEIKRIG